MAEPSPTSDRSGDPLPAGATARLGTLRFRHETSDIALAFFPDGKTLVTAGYQARIWEVGTGIPTPNALLFSVAVSPDGNLLATCGTDRNSRAETVIRLWDAATGKGVRQLAGHESLVFAVAFSPDGRSLASAGHDGTVRLWEVATGREVRQFEAKGENQVVAFSPDGRLLAATAKNGTARVWQAATGKLTCEVPGPAGDIRSIAFSPSGELLAWGCVDRDIHLAQVATGKVIRRLKTPFRYFIHVAFSPDGKTLASGGQGAGARLWDVGSGRVLEELTGPPTTAIAFSPDGKTLAGVGGSNTVRVWDGGSGKPLRHPDGHLSAISAVAFAGDGRTVASAGLDGTVRRWDAATGRQLGRFETNATGPFQRYAFSPDARLVAAAGPRIWSVESGALRPGFDGRSESGFPIALSLDGRSIAEGGTRDSPAEKRRPSRVWDVATGKELGRAGETHNGGVDAVAVSPDGALLAEASQQGIIRASGRIILWDRAGREVRRFGAGQVHYAALAFSPDGKSLASATRSAWSGQAGVQLWEVATGQRLRQLGEAKSADCLAFSPDGKIVAVGRGAEVELWDEATGKEMGRFKGHQGAVTALSFSPDGKTLASGATDTTVLLWPVGVPARR